MHILYYMVTVGTPAGWERREGAVDDVEPAVGKIISYHIYYTESGGQIILTLGVMLLA